MSRLNFSEVGKRRSSLRSTRSVVGVGNDLSLFSDTACHYALGALMSLVLLQKGVCPVKIIAVIIVIIVISISIDFMVSDPNRVGIR